MAVMDGINNASAQQETKLIIAELNEQIKRMTVYVEQHCPSSTAQYIIP